MQNIKYLIEDPITNMWYKTHFSGFYGYTFCGKKFGIHPTLELFRTRDANQALQFGTLLEAENFLKCIKGDYLPTPAIITEHIFIDMLT